MAGSDIAKNLRTSYLLEIIKYRRQGGDRAVSGFCILLFFPTAFFGHPNRKNIIYGVAYPLTKNRHRFEQAAQSI